MVYDDWVERRDGLRCDEDSTHLRSEHMWFAESHGVKDFNKKIKKQLGMKKLRKQKHDKNNA